MRRLPALVAVGVLFLLGLGARSTATSPPQTVFTAPGPIEAFAASGDRFVYVGAPRTADGCDAVQMGSFRSKHVTEIGDLDGSDGCYGDVLIALGKAGAVWGGFQECCNNGYGEVFFEALPGKRGAWLQELYLTYHTFGDFLTAVAADGSTLAYAIVTTDVLKGDYACAVGEGEPGHPCDVGVSGWALKRVVGRRAVAVPAAPPSVLLAVAGKRMALVPADTSVVSCPLGDAEIGCAGTFPRALTRFEIRAIAGGGALAQHELVGTPAAIALSDRLVAVLVRNGGSASLDYFDARTALPRGQKAVPSSATDKLDISGTRIVWQDGKKIHAFDAARGTDAVVATAPSKPIGLTIAGRRIAWAEESGRIRALYLP